MGRKEKTIKIDVDGWELEISFDDETLDPFDLGLFGRRLLRRFNHEGSAKDLNKSIRLTRHALAIAPDHHDQQTWLDCLSNALGRRYQWQGDPQDVMDAVESARQALRVSLERDDDDGRTTAMISLGRWLVGRFEQTEDMGDLAEAIQVNREAFEMAQGHPIPLASLGTLLHSRFEQRRERQDLEEGIRLTQQAIDLTTDDRWDQAWFSNNLGNMLYSRYEQTGEGSDLEEAISWNQKAFDAIPDAHKYTAELMNNLGIKRKRRYDRTGDARFLDMAIEDCRDAVKLTPQKHFQRARHLRTLGIMLEGQYKRTIQARDLEEAIKLLWQAVQLAPRSGYSQTRFLGDLGNMLQRRYERTGNSEGLEDVIQRLQKAVEQSPPDHIERASWLDNLAGQHANRYRRSNDMQDLEAAIRLGRDVVELTPDKHLQRAERLQRLGDNLETRYKRQGAPGDLTEALQLALDALELTLDDHPGWAGVLISLGNKLRCQYEKTGYTNHLDEALGCFESSIKCTQSSPLDRIEGARKAIRILQSREEWERATELAVDALGLLPEVCSRFMGLEDQQYAVVQTSGLAAEACSLLLKRGQVEDALRELEFGRGLILRYMFDRRSDVSELKAQNPALADEYEQYRREANLPINETNPAVRQKMLEERRQAIEDLDWCIEKVRSQTSLKGFLDKPSIEELTACADEGPVVVVNVTDIAADAIIILSEGIELSKRAVKRLQKGKRIKTRKRSIRHLRLPKISITEPAQTTLYRLDAGNMANYRDVASATRRRDQAAFLSRLWSNCVKLVLDEIDSSLQRTSGEMYRVWWIGTGAASAYPFHAAGIYTQQDSTVENTLDRIIPSYTPTINALEHSRRVVSKSIQDMALSQASILIVTMPETPGESRLDGVERERLTVETAWKAAKPCHSLNSPTVEQVMSRLGRSDIVHFACHGVSHPSNPAESHLLLQRRHGSATVVDRLTVAKITKAKSRGLAMIAYLSACSTAAVQADGLSDEGIHIASAFQVAGFGHVIGSLWSAEDGTCVDVARLFYEHLIQNGASQLSNRAVAEALRSALLQLRADFGHDSSWAAYIHSGA